jgi:catechol 2,3-dioxygenase-like lactoylglutathione lyase family enzyme
METTLGWPIWIGVVVEDLDAQRRFWGDLLGLPEDHSGDDYVSFRTPEGRWFELVERSDDPEYDAVRFQVAFEVEDIERTSAELVARGVEHVAGPYLDHGEPWAYFRDPEGTVFSIKQRARPPEAAR